MSRRRYLVRAYRRRDVVRPEGLDPAAEKQRRIGGKGGGGHDGIARRLRRRIVGPAVGHVAKPKLTCITTQTQARDHR